MENSCTLQRQNTEISKKIFPEKEYRGSVPISTFMHPWVIYIFPRSVCLLCWKKYVDRSWDYINRSQTQECGNWGWGRAIPRKGIHKWDFRCSVGIFFACKGPLAIKKLIRYGGNSTMSSLNVEGIRRTASADLRIVIFTTTQNNWRLYDFHSLLRAS